MNAATLCNVANKGMLRFDPSDNKMKYCDSTAWKEMGGGDLKQALQNIDYQFFAPPGGTWRKPGNVPSTAMVWVRCWGGGGGSGLSSYSPSLRYGGGGGSGGFSETRLPMSSLPSTVSVGVGTGGVAGTWGSPTGGNGGSSGFGGYITAGGGRGGTSGGWSGGSGTVATGGAGGSGATLKGNNGDSPKCWIAGSGGTDCAPCSGGKCPNTGASCQGGDSGASTSSSCGSFGYPQPGGSGQCIIITGDGL